jgi:hypothetical protein
MARLPLSRHGTGRRHCAPVGALLEAAPCQAPHASCGAFHECGRGGTGRRAALRSLWPKGRGSSSLLDRTTHAADIPGECRTVRSAKAVRPCRHAETKAIRGHVRFHAHTARRPSCNCFAIALNYRKVAPDDSLTTIARAISAIGVTRIAPIRATGLSPLTCASAFSAWATLATRADSADRRTL